MSIRDYSKQFQVRNMTTGEIFETIPYNMFIDDTDTYIHEVSCVLPVGDVRILNAIHECLENNYDCMINIGYKAN